MPKGMSFKDMMALKGAFDGFTARHPKVVPFVEGVRANGMQAGQEVAIAVRYPNGAEYKTGIRLSEEDLQMLETLKHMKKE